jgi:hypothetical protein
MEKIDPIQISLMGSAIDELMRPKPYKAEPIPDITVKVGDPLDHKRFGKGVVKEVLDDGKCIVVFADGQEKHLISKFSGFKL